MALPESTRRQSKQERSEQIHLATHLDGKLRTRILRSLGSNDNMRVYCILCVSILFEVLYARTRLQLMTVSHFARDLIESIHLSFEELPCIRSPIIDGGLLIPDSDRRKMSVSGDVLA